jgi:signal transduction histidine kinase
MQRCYERYSFIRDPGAFSEYAMSIATDVIGDVVASVRAGEVRIDDGYRASARVIARLGWDECMTSADALGLAAQLLSGMTGQLAEYVAADPALLPCFTVAVAALNESVARRMHAVAASIAANALDRVHSARVEERRRLARELHDRVGEALTVGLRRLDLREILGSEDPPDETVSRDVLVEAMRRLRVVTSDLREPPVTNLEKALLDYLDSVRADAEVQLHISGDETWAPPAVRDELFLILREALRNALTHAAPSLVLVGVEVSTQELSAWVIDNGCGFSQAPAPEKAASGTGLASMRERAALVGGRLVVWSLPGHGTRVELHLPLPDQQPAQVRQRRQHTDGFSAR